MSRVCYCTKRESWGSCQSTTRLPSLRLLRPKDAGTRPTITMTTDPQSNGDLVVEHQTATGESSPNATKRKRANLDKPQQPQSPSQAQLFQDLLELLQTYVASTIQHPCSLILTVVLDTTPHPRSYTCHCPTRRDSPKPTAIRPSVQNLTTTTNTPPSLRACRTTSTQTSMTSNETLIMLWTPSASLSRLRIH